MFLRSHQKFWLLLLIPFSGIHAQTVLVDDNESSTLLYNIAIYNLKKSLSAITDSAGLASIAHFDDSDTLVFQHPAYRTLILTKEELRRLAFHISLDKEVVLLEELILSASRHEDITDSVPQRIAVIGQHEISAYNPQTAADALEQSGEVMVQKSQSGGGSPVLRGFEANRVLLVVDGVRMNHAIFRSGHLQSAISVDPAVLKRADVIFGPASAEYGSDALGGVIHFRTKDPQLSESDTAAKTSLNAFMRIATANNENTTHIDFHIGFKKIGFLTAISHSDFDNLKMGSNRNPSYPDFGKLFHYAGRYQDKDTMLVNSDPNMQQKTGYRQVSYLQKILFTPSQRLRFTANFRYSTTSDIPRFDMLNDYNGNFLKYAEWNYGPQKWLFASLMASLRKSSAIFDEASVIFSFQQIDEDRITRLFSDSIRIVRNEDVNVFATNLHFTKSINPSQSIVYGAEAFFSQVASSAFSENINDSAKGYAPTRYPNGGSDMQSFGFFIIYKKKLNDRIVFTTGARYNFTTLRSLFEDTLTYKFPFKNISMGNGAPSGNAGVVWHPAKGLRVSVLVSTGFRSPNVDDFGKVFAKDQYIIIPTDRLNPEYLYNGEGAIGKKFGKNLSLHASAFYSYLTGALVRKASSLNGTDSLLYDGAMQKIQTLTNAEDAVISGWNASFQFYLFRTIAIESHLTYTFGRNITGSRPMGHIPPLFGRTEVAYSHKGLNTALYAVYHGWKRSEDYSSAGEDNLSEATADGTPAWVTLNFITSYRIILRNIITSENPVSTNTKNNAFVIQFGVENILDSHYKPFSSGISGPGRNFVVALRAEF